MTWQVSNINQCATIISQVLFFWMKVKLNFFLKGFFITLNMIFFERENLTNLPLENHLDAKPKLHHLVVSSMHSPTSRTKIWLRMSLSIYLVTRCGSVGVALWCWLVRSRHSEWIVDWSADRSRNRVLQSRVVSFRLSRIWFQSFE